MGKFLLVAILHILLLTQLRFIAWPENLVWPYLQNHGLHYYKNIFLIYPPLYWWLLSSFYALFNLSLQNLVIFSYLIICLSDWLLWKAAKEKIVPLLIYVPLQIFFEGNGVWVDHLLVPLFLASYIFSMRKKYFLTGLFMGLALLTKQTAVYFILAHGVILFLSRNKTILLKTLGGMSLPLFFTLVYFLHTNSLHPFLSQAVIYILTFHVKHPLQSQLPQPVQIIVTLLVFAPALATDLFKKRADLTIITIAAALGVFTRFEYFHLQPALPFVALLLSLSPINFPVLIFIVVVFGKFLFSSWHQNPRFLDSTTLGNAKIIGMIIRPQNKTLFINTWDHYYFLTQTLPIGYWYVSGTPWTMDFDGNIDRLLQNLAQNWPVYIVYNPCFRIKNLCYRPAKLERAVEENYILQLELSDGTGIFKYDPMRVSQKR